jgi:serine phosphatase RsbU (regulator of sigma subunit)
MTVATAERVGVLLIEDDEDDALIVQDLLAASPLRVRLIHAMSLQKGLALLRAHDVDCVLLDLGLPDVEGLDALRHFRAAAPAIAVVVLTGLDDEAAGGAAVRTGAQDYLVKGKVDSELLSRAIRYAVVRREAEEAHQQLRLADVRADENRRLERGLVPHPIITDPSLWIVSRYMPGRSRALLGGDFYDAVETDGCLHVLIGDVAGRGPDEAALGASLRIAWRALTLSGAPIDSVLPTLQQMIEHERQVEGLFATICTLEVRPREAMFSVRRAGHLPPVLIHGTSIESLPIEPGGPPVGMLEDSAWPPSQFELPPDWSILLFTDGAVEGRDGGDGHLGEDGLRRLIADQIAQRSEWRSDPHALLERLLVRINELNGEVLSDDYAMLLLGDRSAR